MPWENLPESDWPKMDECVKAVTDSGESEESSVAICYDAIANGELGRLTDLGFTLDDFEPKEPEQEKEPPKDLAWKLSAALVDGRDFDGMAEGEFTDMFGREVRLIGEYFSEYASNTNAAIMATKTDSGEIVGLPIDAQGHDNGDGAGWIVAVQHIVRDGVNILRFTPKWTEIGKSLISGGIRRFFSPTVDPSNRIVLGGSLTNWPATRTKKGATILRPIELSQKGVETMAKEKEQENVTVTEIPEVPAVETPAQQPAPILAQLEAQLNDPTVWLQVREAIDAGIKRGVSLELAKMQAESDVDSFVASLESSPVDGDKVRAFLLSLPDKQRSEAREILSAYHNALQLDFTEKGHSKKLEGRAQLSTELKRVLKDHLKDGGTVAQFFEINQADLGAQADYDLSEFEQED